MTLMVGAAISVLVVTLGGFLGDLGSATSDRAAAQAAADSAALAAIAESGPLGGGAHALVAASYAEANGASLVACRCPSGAYSVSVVVDYHGVRASARAAFDPTRLGPTSAPDVTGLDPRLASAVEQIIAASGGTVRLESGFRSTARQTQLWNQAVARYGSADAADAWVAPPGSSRHEVGLAVDLGGDVELAARLVVEEDLPLHRPLAHEPWHFELVGSRVQI